MPRKLKYGLGGMLLSLVISVLKSRWPDIEWPSADGILALTGGLIGAHSLTDIVAIIKSNVDKLKQFSKNLD